MRKRCYEDLQKERNVNAMSLEIKIQKKKKY